MRRTSSWAEVSARSTVATDRPDRRHGDAVGDLLDLVHAVRDEDDRSGVRRARRPRTAGRAWRRPAPTWTRRGSGSGGSRTSARAIPHTCRMLSGSDSTGASRGGASPVSSASRCGPLALDVLGDAAAEQAVDAHPDVRHRLRADDEDLLEDGHDAASSITRGDRTPSNRRPAISIVPLSGRCTPARILTRVLLPEPLTLMTACIPGPRRERALAQRLRPPRRLREAVDREDDLALTGGRLGGRRQGGLRFAITMLLKMSASCPTWRRTDRGSPGRATPRPAPARTRDRRRELPARIDPLVEVLVVIMMGVWRMSVIVTPRPANRPAATLKAASAICAGGCPRATPLYLSLFSFQ